MKARAIVLLSLSLLGSQALAQDLEARFAALSRPGWRQGTGAARPGITELGSGLRPDETFRSTTLGTPEGGLIALVTASPDGVELLEKRLAPRAPSIFSSSGRLNGDLLQRLGVDGYDAYAPVHRPPMRPSGLVFFLGVPDAERARILAGLNEPPTRPRVVTPRQPTTGMIPVLESEVAPVATPGTSEVAPVVSSSVAPVDTRRSASHRVRAGDHLYELARRYGVTTTELALANGISPGKTRILRGKELVIPPPAERVDRVVMKDGRKQHWIQEGDSPSRVAKLYGTTVRALRAANPGTRFQAGGLLVLPEGVTVPPQVRVVE